MIEITAIRLTTTPKAQAWTGAINKLVGIFASGSGVVVLAQSSDDTLVHPCQWYVLPYKDGMTIPTGMSSVGTAVVSGKTFVVATNCFS